MKQPLVSILIPCYNSAPYLAETLKSATGQTWQNCEIIVVDDGSKDESLKVASSFESENVKVVSQENRGSGAARNHAFELSQGEYIQYLDADDLLAPDKVEKQMAELNGSERCLASCRWGRFYDNEKQAYFADEATCQDFEPVDFLSLLYEDNHMMPLHGWLTPRVIAEEAGGWDESLAIDIDGEYFARVVLAAERIVFVEEAECYYRSGLEGSVSGGRSRKKCESLWRSIHTTCQALLDRERSEKTRMACLARYQRLHSELDLEFPDIAEKLAEQIKALGGNPVSYSGGRLFRMSRPVLGPKLARRLDRQLRSLPGRRHPHRTAEALTRYRPMKGEW